MKIAFVINDINTERAEYTTVHLAMTSYNLGHQVYMIDVGGLGYSSDGHMLARAKTVTEHKFKSSATFLDALRKAEITRVSSTDIDVLFLRNDPSVDLNSRNWAQNAPYIFGQIAMRDNVIVLNHPEKLSDAINKMYFQHFPEILRPKTIITRDQKEIEDFFEEQKEKMILKPLQGSGGKNVFFVEKKTRQNLKQIIEAIARDGYIIAQEYLPDAQDGDTRLFLMNGEPLKCNGKYAVIKRKNQEGDVRSNISAGGHPERAVVTDEMLKLSEVLRPKLIQDGMFLVGIDIVGNKLMEINVFSPGGLNMMSEAYGVNFSKVVISAIERKVQYKKTYGPYLDNVIVATM